MDKNILLSSTFSSMIEAAPKDHTHTPDEVGAAEKNHTHTATEVAGVAVLGEDGKVLPEQLPEIKTEPDYTYGTEDLVAGESELAEGKLYFVYE